MTPRSEHRRRTFMERKRLLCFGDSNTYGWIGSLSAPTLRYPKHVRWTGRLAEYLGSSWEVLEEGLGGRTLRDRTTEGSGIAVPGAGHSAMEYMPACLLSHVPLDVLIIMLGSNDMKAALNHSEHDIAENMARLVKMAQELPWRDLLDYPHPQILIMSLPRIGQRKMSLSGSRYTDAPRKSQALAGLYRQVAATLGVEFLDAASAIAGSPWGEAHGEDGMHLNEEDHVRLASAVFEKLRAMHV